MWDNLKASIASVVRTNNNQEITGANLQNVLNTIVNTVGANATFVGIAIPSTNPGTPDGPVFYIACEPGVYSNFNLTLVDGLYILENKTGSCVGTQINTGAAFEALIGYYNAVLNGASITVPDATTYRLTKGGVVRLKMLAPGTTATTLTIGNATDIPIWYNGAAVSAQNTWEANEIISVFYDGTRFMASNSQGGGGKAEKISYNNSQSGLAAENVQTAIDETVERVVEVEEVLVTTIVDTRIEQYKGNVNSKTSGSSQLGKIWGNRHNVASVVDGIYWKCHGSANSLSVYQAKSGSATLIKTFQKDSTWIDGHWIKLYFDSPVTIQSGCYIGVYGYVYFGTTSGVGLQFYCNQNGSGWGSDNNITIGVYSFYEKSKIDEIEESIEDKQTQIDAINEDIGFVIDKTYYEDRLPTVGRTNNKYVHVSNGQVVYDSLNNFYYTGFIYVGDCSSIKIPACRQWGCVFFDANKQYNGNYKYTSTDVTTPVTVDIPENTSYVQVNIKTSDAQYVYCYLSEVKRELSPTLKTKTSQIVDRNGQNLILPLDRIITEPSGGQTSLSENRFTRTGATTNGYLTAAQSGGVWTTTWHSSGQHGCTDYIDIHDATKLTVGCDVTANLVYFDENKVCCGNFVGNGSFTAKTTIPPAGAYYVRMNYDTRYLSSTYLTVYFNVDTYKLNPIVAISPDSIAALKPLSGLKVAWYGTSIPHGYPYQNTAQDTYSYANRAVTELGGIIQNRCVSGGFIISATNTADTHNQTSRFTDIDPEGTYYSAVNYQTKIVDLIGTADEPDIFVFDWGANDGQFYQSYFNGINLDTVDITTEDIKTFIGAYNTIIKALLTAKPKARIFLVTHYSDDGQSNEMTRKDGYRTMNRLIEKIADYWHIPCNSVYKKTGWIYNRNGISNIRSQWCKDGIHPANSANVESIKFLTKIHKQFLMENYCY